MKRKKKPFLLRLTNYHTVSINLFNERLVPIDIPAKGIQIGVPLNGNQIIAFGYTPIWKQSGAFGVFFFAKLLLLCVLEQLLPNWTFLKGYISIAGNDALANRKPLVAVDSSFSLLQIYGIRRQIPVTHLPAILMKIKPFLTN